MSDLPHVRFTGPDEDGDYWLHIDRPDGASGFNLGAPMSDAARDALDLLASPQARAEVADAERNRLRDALAGSADALTHAQEGLNAAADDQQDKHGNVMGAAALRALAMLLDISCARSRAALATPPKSGT